MARELCDARYALLVIENRLDAEFLKSHFSRYEDIAVSWIICDLESCVVQCDAAAPALVILDASYPNDKAASMAVQLMRAETPPGILLLDSSYNEAHASAAEMIGAAYCTRKSSLSHLENTVRLLLYAPLLRPSRRNGLVEDWTTARAKPQQDRMLSARELQVLSMVAEGNDTDAIALYLGLRRSTVAKHRHNIMKKLNVHKAVELVRAALDSGLIAT
jgi:DNA-binding NarL/FixJ family response regulator